MKFAEWIEKESINQAWIAGEMRVSPSEITKLKKGDRTPSPDQIIQIESLSGRKVRLSDWATEGAK